MCDAVGHAALVLGGSTLPPWHTGGCLVDRHRLSDSYRTSLAGTALICSDRTIHYQGRRSTAPGFKHRFLSPDPISLHLTPAGSSILCGMVHGLVGNYCRKTPQSKPGQCRGSMVQSTWLTTHPTLGPIGMAHIVGPYEPCIEGTFARRRPNQCSGHPSQCFTPKHHSLLQPRLPNPRRLGGPLVGRNCYSTPAFSGVPNTGTRNGEKGGQLGEDRGKLAQRARCADGLS